MLDVSADDANDAATRIVRAGHGWGGSRPKVYLVDLAGDLGVTVADLAPSLLRWHREGKVEIQRADLPAAMDAGKLRASVVASPISTFHFIVPPASAAEREPHAVRMRVPPAAAPPRNRPRIGESRFAAKKNPSPARQPQIDDAAVDMYKTFHRYDPHWVGEFGESFTIPSRVRLLGDARFVLYRSSKVDPSTLKKPKRPVDYIHEHDSAGVHAYDTMGTPNTDVPGWLAEAQSLVLLGACLGFGWTDGDDLENEAEVTAPLPELYTIPSGNALLVIEDKRSVAAMMWGGALGVEARGIVG